MSAVQATAKTTGAWVHANIVDGLCVRGARPGELRQSGAYHSAMIPYQPDPYMRALSESIYAVSYLEWACLGDLRRSGTPPEAIPKLHATEQRGWKVDRVGGVRPILPNIYRGSEPADRDTLELNITAT